MGGNKFKLITCQPDDQYFVWQNHLYIESCIEQGWKPEDIDILLYKPKGRASNPNWEKLKEYYPGLGIHLYEDKGIQQYLNIYIPLLRPHILKQHLTKFPEIKNIIYTDSDILWIDGLNISHLLEDDVNYISDASSYLNYSYFEGKKTQITNKTKLYNRDFLEEICKIVGIDISVVKENNLNTGGVQYILKNTTASFWEKIEKDTLAIRKHLLNVNKEFFPSEDAGYQSWCADLWAVQFNLWKFYKETKVADELKFAWAPDLISKLETHKILHNAGITGNESSFPCFYKGKFHLGNSPFNNMEYLNNIHNHPESKKHCTWYYTDKLIQLKNKYNL